MGKETGLLEIDSELSLQDIIDYKVDKLPITSKFDESRQREYFNEAKENYELRKEVDTNYMQGNNGKDYTSLQAYIKDIKNIKKATKEEQYDLFKKYKTSKDKEIRKKLTESNLPLVISIAKGMRRKSVEFIDLIQYGNIGLMRAIEDFDPDMINPKTNKHYEFSTYAAWWIKQAIGREGDIELIRKPVYLLEDIGRYNRIKERMRQESGSEPETEEIAEMMGISLEKVKRIERYGRLIFISLESKIFDEEGSPLLKDTIKDESLPYDSISKKRKELRILLNKTIDNLSSVNSRDKKIFKRDKKLLKMRYGLDGKGFKTLEKVGKSCRISRERVRQIENKMIEKIRKRIPRDLYFYLSDLAIS